MLAGRLCGLVGSTLDHRSLPREFKSRHGHLWRVFHLWVRFITFGSCSTHLAYHVYKSGHKTSIIIIHNVGTAIININAQSICLEFVFSRWYIVQVLTFLWSCSVEYTGVWPFNFNALYVIMSVSNWICLYIGNQWSSFNISVIYDHASTTLWLSEWWYFGFVAPFGSIYPSNENNQTLEWIDVKHTDPDNKDRAHM